MIARVFSFYLQNDTLQAQEIKEEKNKKKVLQKYIYPIIIIYI